MASIRVSCPSCQTGFALETARPDPRAGCPSCQRVLLWSYRQGERQTGPIGWSELRRLAAQGGLQPEDLVAQEGSTHWLIARKVLTTFPPAPPPLPPPLPEPPPLPARAPRSSSFNL